MVLISVFVLGLLFGVGCLMLGVKLATRTVEHSVNTYVKKLTPEESKRIYSKEDIPEENMRALAVDEKEYREIMGWENSEEKADY